SVFVCDAIQFAVSCSITDIERRAIDEPETEKNVRGPHEGFVELLDTNFSILRRKIKNDRLKFKTVTLGTQTSQTVAVAYIEGVANINIVNSLYDKISTIEIDGLSAIGYVEQIIASHPYSLFPQFLTTERSDKAMAALLEGRIVVLQEGTPVALIAPVSFISFFQALDDYSTSWVHGSFLRIVRIAATIVAVVLPSLYIAITSFHYYVVPLNLLIPLAESRSRVPFPPIVEVLILEAIVEMIREAAVRLPTYIGTAISVFASLVVGTAAVEAGIVSNVLIVVVGASAVASYVIPSFDMSMAIRILRFCFTLASSIFGIMGIVVSTGLTLVHLVSINSLGQPYFMPLTPFHAKGFSDTVLRLPLKAMGTRPGITKTKNRARGRNNGRK
ncbi:MAG TPA: spore germination protein, partial [Clostridia bacterium]